MSGKIYHKRNRYKVMPFNLMIILLIAPFAYLVSGCGSPSLEDYENQEWDFSLEYPDNWKLNENTRVANDFSLQATKGLLHKSSAWIYLYVSLPQDIELETRMDKHIEIITKETHESLKVIQISDVIDTRKHEMIWATVSIPTLDLAEDSPFNQMGERTENVSQTIDIYILRNSQGQDILVDVYKGADESLNSQAEDIVQSIKFINE